MIKEKLNNCSTKTIDKIILLKENKSIYKGLNKEKNIIGKYKIDGCVYDVNAKETRCDYLLETINNLYFIELKGVNVKKGLTQLLTSINNLSPFLNQKNKYARLITTRGVKPNRLNTIKAYKDLSKLIGTTNIILRNTPFEESIN